MSDANNSNIHDANSLDNISSTLAAEIERGLREAALALLIALGLLALLREFAGWPVLRGLETALRMASFIGVTRLWSTVCCWPALRRTTLTISCKRSF